MVATLSNIIIIQLFYVGALSQGLANDFDGFMQHMVDLKNQQAAGIMQAAAGEHGMAEQMLLDVSATLAERIKEEDEEMEDLNNEDTERLEDCISAELSFWMAVKQNGFKVPTSGKIHPVAGRWSRAIKDPELRARYDKCKSDPEREQFRKDWAEEKYDEVVATREDTRSKKKKSKTQRTAGATHPGRGLRVRAGTRVVRWGTIESN